MSSDHPRLPQSPELEGVLAGLPLLEADELDSAVLSLLVAVHGTAVLRSLFRIIKVHDHARNFS